MRFIFSSLLRCGLNALWPLGMASLLVVSLGELGLLLPLVQAEYGLRFRLRGQHPWDSQVVLIAIDDPSLQALGAFPWPRQRYAELLGQLQALPPQAIVFDLLFSDPSPDDGLLAAAFRPSDTSVGNDYFQSVRTEDLTYPIPARQIGKTSKNENPPVVDCGNADPPLVRGLRR